MNLLDIQHHFSPSRTGYLRRTGYPVRLGPSPPVMTGTGASLPPTFQRIVNQILAPARWKHGLAYLDDIIIFSKTFDDHVSHLDEILHILHSHNFRRSFEKCTITTDTIDYLGHNTCRGELRPNHDNVRGLLQTSIPNSQKELFRFLKAAEYYRKFIPNFFSNRWSAIQIQSFEPSKPTTYSVYAIPTVSR